MLHRITLKQERAHLDVRGTDWVLYGAEVPQRFYEEYGRFTAEPVEVPGMREDLTRGFRNPRDRTTQQLEAKVIGEAEVVRGQEKGVLETVMASMRRKDEAAAQADTEPVNASGDDPAWP
eukprot:534039-Alexandrium_andersonii.AAC.1